MTILEGEIVNLHWNKELLRYSIDFHIVHKKHMSGSKLYMYFLKGLPHVNEKNELVRRVRIIHIT